jgi:hypothetical protein
MSDQLLPCGTTICADVYGLVECDDCPNNKSKVSKEYEERKNKFIDYLIKYQKGYDSLGKNYIDVSVALECLIRVAKDTL